MLWSHMGSLFLTRNKNTNLATYIQYKFDFEKNLSKYNKMKLSKEIAYHHLNPYILLFCPFFQSIDFLLKPVQIV